MSGERGEPGAPSGRGAPVGHGTVLWDLDARGVATVTLNRPQVNNAYNGDLIQGLHEAMDVLGGQPGLRVLVLRGAGRHFQAGADLRWVAEVARQSPGENARVSRATAEAVRRLDTLPVPTLAVVQGGLTTCMELTANRVPFVYVPLRHHFEQNFHVHHRLQRYRAGRRMDYDEAADPDGLAKVVADQIGQPVDYLPVARDGAARAAAMLAELLP